MPEPLTIQESAFTVQSVYKFFSRYFSVVLLLTALSGLGGWFFVAKQPAVYSANITFLPNARTTEPKRVIEAITKTESMKPFVLVSEAGDAETSLPFKMAIKGRGKFILRSTIESVFADTALLNERRASVREFFNRVQMEAIQDLRTQLSGELSILQQQVTRQELSIGDEVLLRLTSLQAQLDELRNKETLGLVGFGRWELKEPRWFRVILALLFAGFGSGVLFGLAHSAYSRIKDHS